jgi:FMN phosphatase YigB (HAD superfamily)
LVKIQAGKHPYRRILKLGIEQGRRPQANDGEVLLTTPLDLREAAKYFGIELTKECITSLEAELEDELSRLEAYEDGIAAVEKLQAAGVKICICSNLASPYASAIERLYPSIRHRSYSFEVGAVKPGLKIYAYAVTLLELPPASVWMIGDSKRCDRDGPSIFGMNGLHLDRKGDGDYKTLTDFADYFLSVHSPD